MADFKELLLIHYRKYPRLEIEDIFKFIHQGALGCEHMVTSLDTAIERIKDECLGNSYTSEPFIEELSLDFCRVHLSCLQAGVDAETLGKMFLLSSKEQGSWELEKMLTETEELISQGDLKLSLDEFKEKVAEWRKDGYPALHHSKAFNSLYKPKYRVIAKKYIPFLPLLAKIDTLKRQGNLTVAIEGGSASGKTTLAALLSEIYDSTIFHMDDFFLPPKKRTESRLCEIGGNVDRERFLDEILLPLSQGKEIKYRPFDCSTQEFKEEISITPKSIVFVEGVYSMHPSLAEYYDLSVFLDIDADKQRSRILKRNSPSFASKFFDLWIPLENRYFQGTNAKDRCDLIIKI